MATLKKRKGGQGRGGGKRMRSLKEPTGKLDWTASRDDDDEELDSEEEEAAELRGKKHDARVRKEASLLEEDSEGGNVSDDDGSIDETVEDKRLRMAKEYLSKLQDDDDEDDSASESVDAEGIESDDEADPIAKKLKVARLQASGFIRHRIAHNLQGDEVLTPARWMTGHKLSLTCVSLTHDDAHCFTGSKDNAVFRYDVETGQKVDAVIKPWKKGRSPHQRAFSGEVLSVAVSPDNRILATGGRDKLVRLFDLRMDSNQPIAHTEPAADPSLAAFRGHKDYITSLAFDLDASSTLYSASADRLLKVWNAKDRGYMNTLFGHQADVTGIDGLRRGSLVTVGRDRTARFWKVSEETQLVYRGSSTSSSLDCIRMLTNDSFLTGDDRGNLSIWNTHKKKAAQTVIATTCDKDDAFLTDEDSDEATSQRHRPWLTSLSSVRTADLVASGSSDGHVRLWEATTQPAKTLTQVGAVAIDGFANGLAIASDGRFLLCAMGQEHRLGRWERQAGARNALAYVALTYDDASDESESEVDSEE